MLTNGSVSWSSISTPPRLCATSLFGKSSQAVISCASLVPGAKAQCAFCAVDAAEPRGAQTRFRLSSTLMAPSYVVVGRVRHGLARGCSNKVYINAAAEATISSYC